MFKFKTISRTKKILDKITINRVLGKYFAIKLWPDLKQSVRFPFCQPNFFLNFEMWNFNLCLKLSISWPSKLNFAKLLNSLSKCASFDYIIEFLNLNLSHKSVQNILNIVEHIDAFYFVILKQRMLYFENILVNY